MMRQFVLAAALAFGGCESFDKDLIGEGDITLSRQMTQWLDDYMDQFQPMAFAITTDGTYAYYLYCEDPYGCMNQHRAKQVVKSRCEAQRNKPCRILAEAQSIIWRGTVTRYEDSAAAGGGGKFVCKNTKTGRVINVPDTECGPAGGRLFLNRASTAGADASQQAAAGESIRRNWAGDIDWQGVLELKDHPMTVTQRSGGGVVKATFPQPLGACVSEYELKTEHSGRWEMTCENDHAASGELELLTARTGSVGVGKDNQGRPVSFLILGHIE